MELQQDELYDVEHKNWDILIILDACRYDYFKEVYGNYFNGVLKKKKSITSDTEIWVNKMFLNKDCDDIIYITPVVCIDIWLPKHTLFYVAKSWETHFDEEYGTVMADGTTSLFYSFASEFPDKRYIVHYGQPHTPYIGVIPESPRSIENTLKRIKPSVMKTVLFNIWTKLHIPNKLFFYANELIRLRHKSGKVARTYVDQLCEKNSWDGVREEYKNNLCYVLEYVKEIKETFPEKKIVITADHGELLGENGVFGHKSKRNAEVVEIPWLEVRN